MIGRRPVGWAIILAATILQPTCIGSAAMAQEHGQGAALSPYESYADIVDAAAQQFDIPTRWIWAVMAQESGGDPRAVSHAGAVGLMQIMPSTWDDLRARHRLGPDPHDPRDNIMAGAAYLRAMHDRYGPAGMLAAYNAGPGRYEAYLRSGRPLPGETRAYLARLLPRIGVAVPERPSSLSLPPTPLWTEAALFPTRAVAAAMGPSPAPSTQQDRTEAAGHRRDAGTAPSLFIARTGGKP